MPVWVHYFHRSWAAFGQTWVTNTLRRCCRGARAVFTFDRNEAFWAGKSEWVFLTKLLKWLRLSSSEKHTWIRTIFGYHRESDQKLCGGWGGLRSDKTSLFSILSWLGLNLFHNLFTINDYFRTIEQLGCKNRVRQAGILQPPHSRLL